VSVPDRLACAALAGVNPVYGLYASIAAPISGSLLVSAQLMQIATTSASALAVAQPILSYPAERREAAMFLLVVIVGVVLVLFGLLKLGRLVRFVSHAVMTGFLIGVAVVPVARPRGAGRGECDERPHFRYSGGRLGRADGAEC
jgi:sulfate permease, SulP family